MPGLEADLEGWETPEDLEEWETQKVNVTRGEVEGDIDLEGLPFLKVTLGPRHYLFLLFPTVLLFHAYINIYFF